VMTAWLVWAGTSVAAGISIVLIGLTIYIVVARIVAETGLPLMQMPLFPSHFFQFVSSTLGIKASVGSFFYAQFIGGAMTHDTRESLATFKTTALQVRHLHPQISKRSTIAVMFLASLVALVLSFGATLVLEYQFANTLDNSNAVPNRYALDTIPKGGLFDRVIPYATGRGFTSVHDPATHFVFGGGTVLFLSLMSWRFGWWPLSPIGMLIVHTYPARLLWFSVLIGWLLRQLILFLGGAPAYKRCRFLFFGLMVGECAAAGFWMCVNLLLFYAGVEYKPVQLLPP
jgi:hypothetical protein